MVDTQIGLFESTIVRYRPDLEVAGAELRTAAGDDGLYVLEAYRGLSVGKTLLHTAMKIAKLNGAMRWEDFSLT